MPIRITAVPQNNNTGENDDPIGYETTFDNQTVYFGPGQVKVFPDTGVGVGFAASDSAPEAAVIEDNELSTKYYPDANSRT